MCQEFPANFWRKSAEGVCVYETYESKRGAQTGYQCRNFCCYYGTDLLERFSRAGFCADCVGNRSNVRGIYGRGNYSGNLFCVGRGVYDLVSATRNWGTDNAAALHFLFVYWFFLFGHYTLSNGRTANAIVLYASGRQCALDVFCCVDDCCCDL